MVVQAFQNLDGTNRRERIPAHAHVTLDDGVMQAEVDRVELELLCELVEQRLDRERSCRGAGSAVRAEGEPIRLYAVPA